MVGKEAYQCISFLSRLHMRGSLNHGFQIMTVVSAAYAVAWIEHRLRTRLQTVGLYYLKRIVDVEPEV